MHCGHHAQELALAERWVVVELRIAAGDDSDARGADDPANYSVNDQMTVANEYREIAGPDRGEFDWTHRNRFTGPKRRQHAGAANAKTERRAGSKSVPAQFDLGRKVHLRHSLALAARFHAVSRYRLGWR